MNPGKLNKRVTLLRYEDAAADNGLTEQKLVPAIKNKIWAAVEPVNGREYYEEMKYKNDDTVKFTIRYRAGIENYMLVLYGDKLFKIESVVDPAEKHELLELNCTLRSRGTAESYGL